MRVMCGSLQVHRWYRATVEHAYGYVKRFRILGERYRGKLNSKQRTGFNHLHNALLVIANLCAYHNRCEPHRLHAPIPELVPTVEASDSDEEKSDGDDNEFPAQTAAGADAMDVDEEEQPSRKRRRQQDEAADPHVLRVDYGLHEYKWQEDCGTGYTADQFKRRQPVWMWHVFGQE